MSPSTVITIQHLLPCTDSHVAAGTCYLEEVEVNLLHGCRCLETDGC